MPLIAERLIALAGWRYTFAAEAVPVWVLVVPIVVWGLRGVVRADSEPDATDSGEPTTTPAPEWPLRAIVRTSVFWAMAAAVACSGLVATAVFFHQISVLGEQGLTPTQAAADFLPQTVAGLGAALLFGAAADRYPPNLLLITVGHRQDRVGPMREVVSCQEKQSGSHPCESCLSRTA